ncbi:hypothetical protein FC961_09965 [Clostridium botulinum]|uniref:hypothetical protein n=1 Tax=Clostridium TaxID=1485 RepID=UPI0013C786C5|nr:hypothetical protein [Clostridium sp. ZBS12]NFI94713.1 hypothetical protein [Clostridium botulinum]NFO90812.1 hypothetical protein [Clostridium botulinum]
MSNYIELNLDDLMYEEYSDEEVQKFENKGMNFFERIADRRKSIKEKIVENNIEEMRQAMYEELEVGELVEQEFVGSADGRGYISAISNSADYYVMPLAFRDVGTSFKCVMTDRKFIIFEIGSFYRIYRTYVIDYKDVDRVHVNEKTNHIEFFAKKDKYNSIRECSNWLLYYFIQGRFAMSITAGKKDEVFKLFRDKFKITRMMYYLWIAMFVIIVSLVAYALIDIVNNLYTNQ